MSLSATTEMPFRRLGSTGPAVSLHALGAMTFGAETGQAEAHRMLDHFAERGGTLIDTADVYSDGLSEEIIGRWGAARGGMDDMIVASKCRFARTPGSRGGSRRALLKRVKASLGRLATDAIDVFFIHGWDDETDVAETLEALADLRRSGQIHHIGWSNVTAWQLERICRVALERDYPVPCALQPQYSLLERWIELELLPCALENGIGITPWSPLGGGWLTGKYSDKARPSGATRLGEDPDRGVEAYDIRNTEHTHAVLRAVSEVAARYQRPLAHVALSWLASRPGTASILLGARTTEQLADNLGALDLVLSDSDLDLLTRVSNYPLPAYPYRFVQNWSGVRHWQGFTNA